MGTKSCPSKFDCYAKAEPDEPMFVLIARDPLSDTLVHLWRHIMCGDLVSAAQAYAALVSSPLMGSTGFENEKMDEAFECATAMAAWRKERGPR